MSWELSKGTMERLSNEQKYGHPAGLVGKAMADLEAERVKREEEARENSRVMQSFTTNLASSVTELEQEMTVRVAIAEGETLGAWRRFITEVELIAARWRDVDTNTECPACLSRVPRRAKVCAQCRNAIPLLDAMTDGRTPVAISCLAGICDTIALQILLGDRLHALARERQEHVADQVALDARIERFQKHLELQLKSFEARSAREVHINIIPTEVSEKRSTQAEDMLANKQAEIRHQQRVLDVMKNQLEELHTHSASCVYVLNKFGDRWKHTYYTKDLPDDRLDALRTNLAAERPPWAATTEEVALRIRALLAPHAALIAELTAVAHPDQAGDPVEALVTAEVVEEARVALQAQRHSAWTAAVEGEVAQADRIPFVPREIPIDPVPITGPQVQFQTHQWPEALLEAIGYTEVMETGHCFAVTSGPTTKEQLKSLEGTTGSQRVLISGQSQAHQHLSAGDARRLHAHLSECGIRAEIQAPHCGALENALTQVKYVTFKDAITLSFAGETISVPCPVTAELVPTPNVVKATRRVRDAILDEERAVASALDEGYVAKERGSKRVFPFLIVLLPLSIVLCAGFFWPDTLVHALRPLKAYIPLDLMKEKPLINVIAGGVVFMLLLFIHGALDADGSKAFARARATHQAVEFGERVKTEIVNLVSCVNTQNEMNRALLEAWKSTTIAKLRTLTTEEGWAAVAKDARLGKGSPPTNTTHTASTAPTETGTVDVVLESVGEHKARVIMAIRRFRPALELMEAKHLVERAPIEIFTSITRERANEFLAELNSVGGRASIRPTRGA